MKNGIRVCDLKLWLLLPHALSLHRLCLGQRDDLRFSPPSPPDNGIHETMSSGKYFYAHNETRIAMAIAQAHANGGGSAIESWTKSSTRYPDLRRKSMSDGCHLDNRLAYNLRDWGNRNAGMNRMDYETVEIIAMDACMKYRDAVSTNNELFKISSGPWGPHNQLLRDESPVERFVKVLVVVRAVGLEILGEGVYLPATGTMQLVGCTQESHVPRKGGELEVDVPCSLTLDDELPNMTDFESEFRSWRCREEFTSSNRFWGIQAPQASEDPRIENKCARCVGGAGHYATSSGVCDMSVTLQYTPVNPRWNWQRYRKFTLRSTRGEDDPLYFHPVKRADFFPFYLRFAPRFGPRLIETWGRMLLLLLGLACVALQIQHGRSHEEALPFVSLAMLGIQIANHVLQTAIFKDLQIVRYAVTNGFFRTTAYDRYRYDDEFNYYEIMAWKQHVPYQAFAMTAIFMYVWIFHRVGDRRRIMQQRVRKGKPFPDHPPRDGQLVCVTLTILCIVGLCGSTAYVKNSNFFGDGFPEAIPEVSNIQGVGNTDFLTDLEAPAIAPGLNEFVSPYNDQFVSPYNEDPFVSPYNEDPFVWSHSDQFVWPESHQFVRPFDYEFVSPKFYELSTALWGFLNKFTGLVVSLFLLPQLLGNWRWKVQGRPLSAWFYMGLPFLQSLPHLFAIAKHFQLLPIFACYDLYFVSFFRSLHRGSHAVVADWGRLVICTARRCCALSVCDIVSSITATFNYRSSS